MNQVPGIGDANWLIGISVDRFPSDDEETARRVLQFALEMTRGQILILVADRIQRHNRLAFRLASRSRSFSRKENQARNERVTAWARKQGDPHFQVFQKLLDEWSSASERARVRLIRWDDPPGFMEMERRSLISSFCHEGPDSTQRLLNEMLRHCILNRRPSSSEPSLQKKIPFCRDYLIEELPTLMAGLRLSTPQEVDCLHYSVVIHPVIDSLASANSILHLEPLIENLKSLLSSQSEFAKDAKQCRRFDLHVLKNRCDWSLISWDSIAQNQPQH